MNRSLLPVSCDAKRILAKLCLDNRPAASQRVYTQHRCALIDLRVAPLPYSKKEKEKERMGEKFCSSEVRTFGNQGRKRGGCRFFYLSIDSQDKLHRVAFVHLFQ